MECPIINANNPRCSEHMNMQKLNDAFKLCTDHYKLCPLYQQLCHCDESLLATAANDEYGQ